jgi:CDP-diacylglycerol--glycerol-3-phosphate 3-phosphatidyltransferase
VESPAARYIPAMETENTPKRKYVRTLPAIVFGESLAWARDLIALRILFRIGITPNMLTVMGTVFTLLGGYFLAVGGEQNWGTGKTPYPFYAGVCFFFACAMDMLDGSLARVGNLHTQFGGLLDSTLDRISDMAIFGGIALCYARTGNITYTALALVALSNAVMISYIKARTECELPSGTIGFWQRGERMVGVLVSSFAAHINTLTLMMAILPAMSAAYRLHFSYKQCQDPTYKPPAPTSPLHFWRYPRGAWPFVATAATYILILAFVKLSAPDFLRCILDFKCLK